MGAMSQDREASLDALFADLPPMLTADEVAELLHLTRQNTYTWLRDGVIPGYKFGSSWRVSREELKDLMRNNRNQLQRPAQETKQGKEEGD